MYWLTTDEIRVNEGFKLSGFNALRYITQTVYLL